MSDWTLRTVSDMTSLVLRLAEHHAFPDDWNLGPHFMHTFLDAARILGKEVESFTSGDDFSATAHQRRIAQLALDVFGNHPNIPSGELSAAEAVIKACDDIDLYLQDSEALPVISNRVEWAAKLAWMQREGLALHDLTTQNMQAVQMDLQWGDIRTDGPALTWFTNHGGEHINKYEVRAALDTPPQTRAQVRVKLAKMALDAGLSITNLNWNEVVLEGDTYALNDPFLTNNFRTDTQLKEFINRELSYASPPLQGSD